IRAASRRKIGILIARLNDDTPSDAHRERIRSAIRRELGDAVEIVLWSEPFGLGHGHQYDVEERVYREAQKALSEKNCDLLISGWVVDKSVLSLRFTVAETPDNEPKDFKLTEMFDLPADFTADLGSSIAARVVLSASA